MSTQLLCNDIENDLTRLCAHFEEELQRQKLVSAICLEQGAAARAHNIADMNEKTHSLVELMDAALEHEKERLTLLKRIVNYYQLPEKNHTLSELIKAVPAPWKFHMQRFQSSIQKVLQQTQETVRNNEGFMRNASEKLDASIKKISGPEKSKDPSYSSNGNLNEESNHSTPTMLNAVG